MRLACEAAVSGMMHPSADRDHYPMEIESSAEVRDQRILCERLTVYSLDAWVIRYSGFLITVPILGGPILPVLG